MQLKINDKIKVESWPRPFDSADAFAGYIGVIETLNIEEDHISIRGETSLLIGNHLKKLKFKK